MTTPELTQSRCPDAYTALAFALGTLVGIVPFTRLVIHAVRYLAK